MRFVVFLVFSAAVASSEYADYKIDYKSDFDKKSDSEEDAYKAYIYQGKFPGKCGKDGIYYKDETTFVFCSNGNSYIQPCAPGSRNSPYSNYNPGGKYNYRDFCDVNLVDEGYAAHRALYGHRSRHPFAYGTPERDVVYGRKIYAGYDLNYGRLPRYLGRYDQYWGAILRASC